MGNKPRNLQKSSSLFQNSTSFPGSKDSLASESSEDVTSGRGANIPYLELRNLREDDEAEYRCRVDFRSAPRENLLAVLFVLGEFCL